MKIDGNIPQISRMSPFSINETIQIFGEDIIQCEVYAWQPDSGSDEYCSYMENQGPGSPDTVELPPLPPEGSVLLEVTGRYPQVLYARSPMSGVTILWLKNTLGDVYSKPYIVNKPEIWSQSMTEAMAGERLQLFGQNLFVDQCTVDKERNFQVQCTDYGTHIPVVCLKSKKTGSLYRAEWGLANDQDMPDQNRHRVDLRIPEEIPAEEYHLWVHNGTGGIWGGSAPVSVKIIQGYDLIGYRMMAWNHGGVQTPQQQLAVHTLETVTAPAKGNMGDATEQIQKAINKVSAAGGGVVLLKAGMYGISKTLELKPGVVLKGEGCENTVITVTYGKRLEVYWPQLCTAKRKNGAARWASGFEPYFRDKMKHSPMLWIQSDAGMEDLQLIGGAGTGCLVLVANGESSPSNRVFFNRVKAVYEGNPYLQSGGDLYFQYHGIIAMSETRQFTMYQCDITAPLALNLLTCRHEQVRLIGNRFEVSPRQGTINTFVGSCFHSMIVENTFLHGKRSLMSQMGFSNNWVFQNRSIGVGRGTNGQEEFMSEFGDSSWYGTVAEITSEYVLVPEITDEFPLVYGGNMGGNLDEMEHYLYIAKGRGMGQYRKITDFEEGKIYIETNWDALPDENSEFAILNISRQNLWINNTSENGGGLSQFIFGAGMDNIIAGHEMLGSGGISLWAFPYARDDQGKLIKFGVVAFNQIIHTTNRFSANQNAAVMLWSKSGKAPDYQAEPYNILGNVIRGNIIAGNEEGALLKNQTFRYWMLTTQPWLNFNPELTSGIEINGCYNLVEQNLVVGMPNGVLIRGKGPGNEVVSNRMEYCKQQPMIRKVDGEWNG